MGTLQIFPRLGSWPQKHVEPCLGQTQYICGPCVPAVLLADSLWSQVTAGAIPLKDTVGVGQFFCVAAGLSLEVTRKSIFFFFGCASRRIPSTDLSETEGAAWGSRKLPVAGGV